MTSVLSWMLGMAWRIAILLIAYTTLKAVLRNGNGTLRDILETLGLAIRAGCLSLRGKLLAKLRSGAEEKETEEAEEPKGPEIQVEGSVR